MNTAINITYLIGSPHTIIPSESTTAQYRFPSSVLGTKGCNLCADSKHEFNVVIVFRPFTILLIQVWIYIMMALTLCCPYHFLSARSSFFLVCRSGFEPQQLFTSQVIRRRLICHHATRFHRPCRSTCNFVALALDPHLLTWRDRRNDSSLLKVSLYISYSISFSTSLLQNRIF